MLLPSFSDTNMFLMIYSSWLHFVTRSRGLLSFLLHQIGLRCTTVEDLRLATSVWESCLAVCTFLHLIAGWDANWYEVFHR